MKFKFFDNRRIRQGWTLLLIGGALVCMFPPRHPAFDWWAAHAVQVALGYLALGLIFLILNKSRLLLVCFGCSAAISFFYYETNKGAHLSSMNQVGDSLDLSHSPPAHIAHALTDETG